MKLNEKNRNTVILVVIVIAVFILLTDPNGVNRLLTTINLIASTVFFVVAALWVIRRL